MNPTELARAFQEGRFVGHSGPLRPKRALLTRKSLLLFADDVVLKLRRPRDVDGYDQSVMSARYAMAARERWIGRQLSPDVYLQACELHVDDDGAQVELRDGSSDGEPVVLMRRLPDAHRADIALPSLEEELAQHQLGLAMERLAAFHATQEHHVRPPFGDAERPRARFTALMGLVAPALEPAERKHLEGETGEWLERLAPTFFHRVSERRIRSIHGELRLEHLFLPGDLPVESPGALAFIDPHDGHDGERAIDTAEEVMSLAVELELLLGRTATDRVVETYAGHTADASLRKVAPFYRRLAHLRHAADALADASEPGTHAGEARARARFFIARASR